MWLLFHIRTEWLLFFFLLWPWAGTDWNGLHMMSEDGEIFKCNILWLTGYGWHTRDANESALSDWSVNVTEAATCLSVVYPPWALLGNHASPVLYWGVGPGGGLVVFRVCTECKGCGSPVWYTASHTEIYIYIFFFTLTLFFSFYLSDYLNLKDLYLNYLEFI